MLLTDDCRVKIVNSDKFYHLRKTEDDSEFWLIEYIRILSVS